MSQLSLIRQGGLLADIEDALSECVREVCVKGKGGTVTVKIAVKPATKNSSSTVVISDEVVLKAPKLPTAESILYADDDGSLCESDPRQRKFNFEKVSQPQEEAVDPDRFQKVH